MIKNIKQVLHFIIKVLPGPITNLDIYSALESTRSSNMTNLNKYKKWETDFGSC
jgi:hypothetical protein